MNSSKYLNLTKLLLIVVCIYIPSLCFADAAIPHQPLSDEYNANTETAPKIKIGDAEFSGTVGGDVKVGGCNPVRMSNESCLQYHLRIYSSECIGNILPDNYSWSKSVCICHVSFLLDGVYDDTHYAVNDCIKDLLRCLEEQETLWCEANKEKFPRCCIDRGDGTYRLNEECKHPDNGMVRDPVNACIHRIEIP